MPDIDSTIGAPVALRSVARDLHKEFDGIFGEETVYRLALDSYQELAATATVTRWLVISTEQFTRQRLQALVHAEAPAAGRVPGVLFLCVHNAGRSQMALGWFRQLVGDHAIAWSGGSDPGSELIPAVVEAMAEVGIDITHEFAKPWTEEFLLAADAVVTMGCGDSCPLYPGKHYEDWELDDPAGKAIEEIRPIRDEIHRRVIELIYRLGVPTG